MVPEMRQTTVNDQWPRLLRVLMTSTDSAGCCAMIRFFTLFGLIESLL